MGPTWRGKDTTQIRGTWTLSRFPFAHRVRLDTPIPFARSFKEA